jgi:hypothetical protein
LANVEKASRESRLLLGSAGATSSFCVGASGAPLGALVGTSRVASAEAGAGSGDLTDLAGARSALHAIKPAAVHKANATRVRRPVVAEELDIFDEGAGAPKKRTTQAGPYTVELLQ